MSKRDALAGCASSMRDLETYHRDAESSLRLYFAPINPDYRVLFKMEHSIEMKFRLAERIKETELRSSFAILARIEAVFRIDYQWRRKSKGADALSIAFRRYTKNHVRLDEDIWEAWRTHHAGAKPVISQLRSAFKFRHWLAHGRYWQLGQNYDFEVLSVLCRDVFTNFPLRS